MSTSNQPPVDVTTDPTRIRALAHPIRLALLDYLGSVDSATATQCAEAVGESVASCSFHLRTLAKHGFIERAESDDAKSRPWRAIAHDHSQRYEPTNPESLPAVAALGTAVVSQVSARLNAFLQAAPTLPQAAIDRSTLSTSTMWLTTEEHTELIERFIAMYEPFRERSSNPDSRPENSMRQNLFIASTPELAHFTRNGTPDEQ